MRLRCGTSGFGYREWRGKFYPEACKPAQMLPFYAERFAAVEINASFYRLPARGGAPPAGSGERAFSTGMDSNRIRTDVLAASLRESGEAASLGKGRGFST